MCDRLRKTLAKRRLILHAVRGKRNSRARIDETLGVGCGVTPCHEITQRHTVGRHWRHEIRRLRELKRNDERRVRTVRKCNKFCLRAEFVAVAKHSDRRLWQVRLHKLHEPRDFEFITRIHHDSMRTCEQRLQCIERIHIFSRQCRRRSSSEAFVAPCCIEKCLTHDRVRTHQARWIATLAIITTRNSWRGWRWRTWSRRVLHATELTEIHRTRTHDLHSVSAEFALRHSLSCSRKDAQIT